MPRHRTHHSRITYVSPHESPQNLVRFREELGLSWAELTRPPVTHPHPVRRWRNATGPAGYTGCRQ